MKLCDILKSETQVDKVNSAEFSSISTYFSHEVAKEKLQGAAAVRNNVKGIRHGDTRALSCKKRIKSRIFIGEYVRNLRNKDCI